MFRQSLKKAASFSSLTRLSRARMYSNKPEPQCAHHKELVPPFNEICKLKSYELKSDCTTFHMKTAGYDCCCPKPCPTCPPAPCPPKPCPC